MLRFSFIFSLLFAGVAGISYATTVESITGMAPALPTDYVVWVPEKKLTWSDLKGNVVLVHFWNEDSAPFKENLPYIEAWKETYSNQKFKIIGIHIPDYARFSPKYKEIAKRCQKYEKVFTSVVDPMGSTMKSWGVKSPPTLFLIDKHGQLRYQFQGQLVYRENYQDKLIAKKIEYLLKEKN